MPFDSLRFTPIGGNSRSGVETTRNAPMGWGYLSTVDNVETVSTAGYFDTMNKLLAAGQFIYCSLKDNNVIFTIESVDRTLQQVTLATEYIQPALPSAKNVTPIFKEADFEGTVINDSIQINPFQKYLMMDYTLLTKNLFTTPGVGAVLEFESTFFIFNRVAFKPPTELNVFLKSSATVVRMMNFLTEDAANGDYPARIKGENIFLDLDNGNPDTGLIRFFEGSVINFKSMGTIQNYRSVFIDHSGAVNCGGLIIRNCLDVRLGPYKLNGNQSDPGNIALSFDGDRASSFISMQDMSFEVPDQESAVYIDPYLADDATIQINSTEVLLSGDSSFFQEGRTEPIEGIGADHSSSGNVTGVVAGTVDGELEITISIDTSNFWPHQEITLYDMVDTAYNETYNIKTVGPTYLIIEGEYSGDSSGKFQADAVSVELVSQSEKYTNGDTVLIENTINYNGGAKAFDTKFSGLKISRPAKGVEFGEDGHFSLITSLGDGFSTVTLLASSTLKKNQFIFLMPDAISEYKGSHFIASINTAKTEVTIKLDSSVLGTDTGGWVSGNPRVMTVDNGSITGTDPRMMISGVAGEKDSQLLFSYTIDSIQTGEVITITNQSQYTDFKFVDNIPILDGTEKFTLVDVEAGTFRYDGAVTKTFQLSSSIAAENESGNTATEFAFVPWIYRASDTAFRQLLDVGQAMGTFGNVPLSVPISGATELSQGDLIKMRLKNLTSTSNLNVRSFSFNGS